MTDYDNNMRGVLFKNDDKREGKQDPDYRGNAEVTREQFWVNAWIKTAKDGRKYMSLSFQPKQAKDVKGAVAKKAAPPADDLDDEIPF